MLLSKKFRYLGGGLLETTITITLTTACGRKRLGLLEEDTFCGEREERLNSLDMEGKLNQLGRLLQKKGQGASRIPHLGKESNLWEEKAKVAGGEGKGEGSEGFHPIKQGVFNLRTK